MDAPQNLQSAIEGIAKIISAQGQIVALPDWSRDSARIKELCICSNRAMFEQHFRELRRPDIGSDADALTEADFVSELAEDGWPGHRHWLAIYSRLHDGGELTPRERAQALAYWAAGEDEPSAEYRFQ